MQYTPYMPEGELSAMVEVIFHVKDYTPEHHIERLVPDGFASLVIELDDQERYIYDNESLEKMQVCTGSWVSGLFDQYISISALPRTELIAVRFKPGGLFPFLTNNTYDYHNIVLPGMDVLGHDTNVLRKDLKSIISPMEKTQSLARWLERKKINETTPAIQRACQHIMHNPTLSTIEEVVTASGYSKKQFIHLFKKEIGLTPKLFQRIMKFQQILPHIQNKEKVNWTQISHDCGYYDQAHFIRDFKRFSGYNPSEFLDNDFDRSNFFPVE